MEIKTHVLLISGSQVLVLVPFPLTVSGWRGALSVWPQDARHRTIFWILYEFEFRYKDITPFFGL